MRAETAFVIFSDKKSLMDRVYKSLAKNVENIQPQDGLKTKLSESEKERRPLIIKLGFDPTAPDLHLGHAVVLQKLKDFQDENHKIVIIIGDFTASIGDPTGRNQLRPPLSRDEIEVNCQTYISQLSKIVDVEKVEIRRNSEWHDKLDLQQLVRLLAKVNLAQIMQRDDFRTRYQDASPIAMHELLYPILQGYDSIMIEADIELGGADQLLNCMMGRLLQQSVGMKGQTVISMPLLVGTDGTEKMSKSKKNYIGLTEEPSEIFGKIMSIPDALISNYFELASNINEEELRVLQGENPEDRNPMELKKYLASKVVGRFYSDSEVDGARAHFERVFQRNEPSLDDYAVVTLASRDTSSTIRPLLDVCGDLKPNESRSQIRRQIRSGAVRLNQEKILDPEQQIEIVHGTKLSFGKRQLYLFQNEPDADAQSL